MLSLYFLRRRRCGGGATRTRGPIRRPARRTSVARPPMRSAFASGSLEGPRTSRPPHRHPDGCNGLAPRVLGRGECLAFLRETIPAWKTYCARPAWPASRATQALGHVLLRVCDGDDVRRYQRRPAIPAILGNTIRSVAGRGGGAFRRLTGPSGPEAEGVPKGTDERGERCSAP